MIALVNEQAIIWSIVLLYVLIINTHAIKSTFCCRSRPGVDHNHVIGRFDIPSWRIWQTESVMRFTLRHWEVTDDVCFVDTTPLKVVFERKVKEIFVVRRFEEIPVRSMRTHANFHKDIGMMTWGDTHDGMRTHELSHEDTCSDPWGHMHPAMRTHALNHEETRITKTWRTPLRREHWERL